MRVGIVAFERLPEDCLRPLASEARVVAATGTGGPYPSGVQATRDTRVGTALSDAEEFRARLAAGDFGRYHPLGDLSGDLGAGTTTTFLLRSRNPQDLPHIRGPVYESLELRVQLTAEAQFDVVVEVRNIDDLPPSLPFLEGLAAPEPLDYERDLFRAAALVSAPADADRPAVTILGRSPFDEHGGIAIGVTIEVERVAGFPRRTEAVRQRGIDGDPPRRLRGIEEEEPVGERSWPGYEAALRWLANGDRPRAVLGHLARESGARLAGDAALSLPDARVTELAARVAAGSVALSRPLDRSDVSWLIEREALLLCLGAGEAEGDDLVPGLLLARAGDVGRYPSDLSRIVLAAGDLAAFEEALVRENLLHLEDNSPSARVRAFDWLGRRDMAPAGYDPLGSREERRKALDAAAADESGGLGP